MDETDTAFVTYTSAIRHKDEPRIMAKKKRATSSPRQLPEFPRGGSTPAERVVWLLESVWGGNRSAMARDVGCSHSVLSKIAAGYQSPGRRLLTDIAAHPKVNPAWLLGGEGEPMLALRPDAPADGWPVPISKHLLPSSPDKDRSLLSGEHFPTAGAFYRSTRYWYDVQKNEPIVRDTASKIDAGDLLLMETDPNWRRSCARVEDKTCVLWLNEDHDARLGLGRVIYDPGSAEESGYFGVDTFESDLDRKDLAKEVVVRVSDDGTLDARWGWPRRVEKQGGMNSEQRVSHVRLGRRTHQIQLESIVAVCLMVVRR